MAQLQDFLRLLNGDVPRQVLWTADLEYWITGREVEGTADPAWRSEEGFLRLCNELRVMPYYFYGSSGNAFWLAEPQYDRHICVTTEQAGATTTTSYETPAGCLIEQTQFMPQSCSQAHTRFAVQTEHDLDIFRYLIEHRTLKPALINEYRSRRELWARHGGLPSIALPRSPLSAFFYEWAGVLNGVYLINDHRAAVEDLFAMMRQQEEPVLDAVCDLSPPLVHFADNMSGDNMTGYYDALMAPGHQYRLARLHAAGTRGAIHLDGVVRGLLPKLASAGFDAVEALTPAPGGDMDVEELRAEAANEDVILWGGVPAILFAPPFTWEDMERCVRRTLDAWRGTRFVLGVADQIPPDGNIDFCRRIADIACSS